MNVALELVCYAILLGTVGTSMLSRARWVERAPRLAVFTWLVLLSSILMSLVLAGLVLTVSTGDVSGGLAELLRACADGFRAQYAAPDGGLTGAIGAGLALGMILRCGWSAVTVFANGAVARRRHRRVLAMVGRPDLRLGAVVVDHDSVAAYCLPGRLNNVVVTSATLATLTEDQLEAVLAHERAHLRGRHYLLTSVIVALARAFPYVPALGAARREVERLTELIADDSATRSCRRLALADALLAFGAGAGPAWALRADGSATACRIRRLLRADSPLSRGLRLAGTAVALSALLLPLVLAAWPAVVVMEALHCPLGRG